LTLTITGQVVIILVLIFASAFFTASEIGFLTISRSRVEHWRERRLWASRAISYLHARRALLLSVLLVSITCCNYMAERIAVGLGTVWLGATLGPAVAMAVMTILIIVFAETTPMHLAASIPERTVRAVGVPVFLLSVILTPVVVILSGAARGLLRLLGVRTGSVLPSVSEEVLKAMIETSQEQGHLEASEKRMLRGVLEFGDQKVSEVMTPRRDMVCLEQNDTMQHALEVGIQSRHSRLPVYDRTPDDIVGVVSLKDLLPYLAAGEMDKPCRLAARPAYYVLETLLADLALKQLQSARQLMAIVRDEYGGTAGLVTVEDLLEEIVGDILDEYDQEEPEVVEVASHEYLCDARVSLRMLSNYINQPLPIEEFDSLGGWLLDLAGRIPSAHESFQVGALEMTVEKVSETHIQKVRVVERPGQSSGPRPGGSH
jgi:putative hemolysin